MSDLLNFISKMAIKIEEKMQALYEIKLNFRSNVRFLLEPLNSHKQERIIA